MGSPHPPCHNGVLEDIERYFMLFCVALSFSLFVFLVVPPGLFSSPLWRGAGAIGVAICVWVLNSEIKVEIKAEQAKETGGSNEEGSTRAESAWEYQKWFGLSRMKQNAALLGIICIFVLVAQ